MNTVRARFSGSLPSSGRFRILRPLMAVAAWQAGGAVTPEALERELAALHRPRPILYWTDLLCSAALGWTAFVFAGLRWGSPAGWAAFGVAVLALYRAALFIHELAHLARGAVPGFVVGWNLLAGLPLQAPSLLYVGSHGDHHKTKIYGTAEDPEYAPLAHWSRARLLGTSLALLLVPPLLVLRWGVLGPLGWGIPPLRRWLTERLSTLVINPAYKRRAPKGRMARRWWIEEIAAAAVAWSAVAAIASGWLGLHWALLWYLLLATILMLNHLRTLTAHRYTNRGERMDEAEQLADSINLWGSAWQRPFTALMAPVGLRFHALHHWFPTLPYHSLGAVHRTLSRTLPDELGYGQTVMPALLAALAALIARADDATRF